MSDQHRKEIMNEKKNTVEEIKICRDWNEIKCEDCEEYLNCELIRK